MSEDAYTATYREYVAAIFEVGEEGLPVIQARIAEWLGVSRASVSEMIRKMESDGLVSVNSEITLTQAGRHLAEVVVRRHRLAERFLSEVLGLPWVKVHAEAEVWELAISDDVEAAMLAKLGRPTTCPHGNPIPGAGYRQPNLMQMSKMPARKGSDEPMVLHRISEELELDNEIMGFLDDSGLRPGASVELVTQTRDGTLTVAVGHGERVGISPFIAERLFLAATPV
ncbi:MAG: metal-dependent transcriptional regulator [Acidimicrobiia bacterium]|nr:metal-dependent transcriptional regulator [Acidimicrobiia bacterium]MDQ3499862.1 metal-dependent transcriptional regulator [Actinomycetota bacterium]